MKILTFILIFMSLTSFSQEGYLHDPSLDAINGSVGNVDATLNGYFSQYGQWLTIANVATAANSQSNASISTASSFITDLTNKFSSFSNSVASQLFNFANGGTNFQMSGTNSTTTQGTLGLGTFNGQSFSMEISMRNSLLTPFQSLFPLIRSVMMAVVYFVYFKMSLAAIRQEMFEALSQHQTRGMQQQVFGNNTTLITGPIFSAVIVAIISTAIGFILTRGFAASSFTNSLPFNSFFQTTANTLPGWDVLTAMCPITDLLLAFVNWVFYRYIYMTPLFYAVRAIIRAISI